MSAIEHSPVRAATDRDHVRTDARASGWAVAIGFVSRHRIWLLLGILCLALAITEPRFRTLFNVSNVLLDASFIALIAIGLTPVIISKNIDLSVGAIAGLTSCLCIGLIDRFGTSVAVAIAILSGTGLGMLNGIIVERAKLNSFIVTLAALIGIRGLAFLYAGQNSLSASDFTLTEIGQMTIGPISVLPIMTLVLALAAQWMLVRTIHGRNTFAIGGNRTAAINAGVRVSRHVIANFAFSGFAASLAGVAMAAYLGTANANFARNYELWAIAAVVLGGTRLTGGVGTAIGSVAAVIMFSVMRNGMNLKQVPSFYVLIVMGFALILALVVDQRLGHRRTRADRHIST